MENTTIKPCTTPSYSLSESRLRRDVALNAVACQIAERFQSDMKDKEAKGEELTVELPIKAPYVQASMAKLSELMPGFHVSTRNAMGTDYVKVSEHVK